MLLIYNYVATIVLDTITYHDDAEFLLSLRMARHLLEEALVSPLMRKYVAS